MEGSSNDINKDTTKTKETASPTTVSAGGPGGGVQRAPDNQNKAASQFRKTPPEDRCERRKEEILNPWALRPKDKDIFKPWVRRTRLEEMLKPWEVRPTHYYRDHVLLYDQKNKIPILVAEHHTAKNITGGASRKQCTYQSLEEGFTATDSDYMNNIWGVIRGHMAAAGNHKSSQGAMQDTFDFTNIFPQYKNEYWNKLEKYSKLLTKTFPNVYVISGTAFLPIEENGKRKVQPEVLGKSNVAIPTHLYKIILVEGPGDVMALEVFLVPNKTRYDKDTLLCQFALPNIKALEQLTGLEYLKSQYENQIQKLSDVEAYACMGQNEHIRFLKYMQLKEPNSEVRDISIKEYKEWKKTQLKKELI